MGSNIGIGMDYNDIIPLVPQLPPHADITVRHNNLNKFLEDQIQEKNFTDLDIICSDGYVPVHRCLLMGASSLLAKLLGDKNLIDTCAIDVPDLTVKEMTQIVELVYTGRTVITKDDEETVFLNMTMFGLPVNEFEQGEAYNDDLQNQTSMAIFVKRDISSSSNYVRCSTDILRENTKVLGDSQIGNEEQEQDHKKVSNLSPITNKNCTEIRTETALLSEMNEPFSPKSTSSRIDKDDSRNHAENYAFNEPESRVSKIQESENNNDESSGILNGETFVNIVSNNVDEVPVNEHKSLNMDAEEIIVSVSDSEVENDFDEGSMKFQEDNNRVEASSNLNDTIQTIVLDSDSEEDDEGNNLFRDTSEELWNRPFGIKLKANKADADFVDAMKCFTQNSKNRERNILRETSSEPPSSHSVSPGPVPGCSRSSDRCNNNKSLSNDNDDRIEILHRKKKRKMHSAETPNWNYPSSSDDASKS